MKLIINEPGSNEAMANIASALKKGYALYTVDFALLEGLNVIWKHANVLKDFKREEAISATEDFAKIYDGLNVVSARDVRDQAIQIALTENITVYDAVYVAAAQKLKGMLYTADQKLCTGAKKIARIRLLESK